MLANGPTLKGVRARYHSKFGPRDPCPDPTADGRRYKVEAFGSDGGALIEGAEIVQTNAKLVGVRKALDEIAKVEPADGKQKVRVVAPTATFANKPMEKFKGLTSLPETSIAVRWLTAFKALIREHLPPDRQPKIGINSQIGYPNGTGLTHDDVFSNLIIEPDSRGTVGVGACLRLIIKVRPMLATCSPFCVYVPRVACQFNVCIIFSRPSLTTYPLCVGNWIYACTLRSLRKGSSASAPEGIKTIRVIWST